MPFTTIAKVADFPVGASALIELRGHKIAVFHCADGFHALADACTHRGASLSEGTFVDDSVQCPWHGAKFNLQTGAHLCPPASKGVSVYPVQVANDELQIDVP